MDVAKAVLKPREDRRIRRGHPWAYRNEFSQLPELADGDLVDVHSSAGPMVGRGFYQASGGIAVRMLGRQAFEPAPSWWSETFLRARELREAMFPDSTTYRWVHGESDGLPGLVVDRYGAWVIGESPCAFHRRHADSLTSGLQSAGIKGGRLILGGQTVEFGDFPEEISVDLEGFEVSFNTSQIQKTGLFLDQRENRRVIARFARGKHVLDGHCHVGLWSLHAARAGAASVIGADTSAAAAEQAQANAQRNGFGDVCTFETAAVEDTLSRLSEAGKRPDVIILDPPAFAKSRGHSRKAARRYHELNKQAAETLAPGGYLITCSCSHFVDAAAFHDAVKTACMAAKRRALCLESRGAAPDHPVLMAMPETAYLKCLVLRLD